MWRYGLVYHGKPMPWCWIRFAQEDNEEEQEQQRLLHANLGFFFLSKWQKTHSDKSWLFLWTGWQILRAKVRIAFYETPTERIAKLQVSPTYTVGSTVQHCHLWPNVWTCILDKVSILPSSNFRRSIFPLDQPFCDQNMISRKWPGFQY